MKQLSGRQLLRSPRGRFALQVGLLFGLLLAWKWRCLFDPPYNEYAEAFWSEAAYLAESGFDYAGLLGEAQIAEGGPRAYVSSLLSAGLAVVMRVVPTPWSLALAHVIELSCASVLIVGTVWLLRRQVNLGTAIAVAAGVYTLPLFNVHLEMLGMETPLALAMLLAIACYANRWPVWSAIVASAAYVIKQTSLPFAIALAGCLACDLWLRATVDRAGRRRVGTALGLLVLMAIPQFLFFRYLARDGQAMHASLLVGVFGSVVLSLLNVPYLWPVYACIAWTVGLRLWQSASNDDDAGWLVGLARRLRVQLQTRPGLTLAYFYLTIATGSLLTVVPMPKYFVSLLPALAVVLADLFFATGRPLRLVVVGLAMLLAHNAWNQFGRWLPPAPPNSGLDERTLAFAERSLGYREDLASIVRALRLASDLSPAEPVLAGKLDTQMLATPYLGYINKPVRGYSVLDAYPLGALRPAVELLADQPQTLIVLGCHSGECRLPPARPGDEILYDDGLSPPLVVYRRRFDRTAGQAQYEEFYRELVRANPDPSIPYSVVTVGGNANQSPAYLRRRMERLPVTPDLLDWLAEFFASEQAPAVAQAARDEAARRRGKSPPEVGAAAPLR